MTDAKQQTAQRASHLLADSYVLYLKTHNFHWNVTGPMFSTLHTMFETQYTELALAVDEIAERIRALGVAAPGTYTEFLELSSVVETEGVPQATEMIRILAQDSRKVVETARKLVEAAQAGGDDASADLAIRRIELHEKNAWMLEAHLE